QGENMSIEEPLLNTNFPPPVYELLEWFNTNWSDANALRIKKMIPPHLRLWLQYCQLAKLITPDAMPRITELGLLVLDQQKQRMAAEAMLQAAATVRGQPVKGRAGRRGYSLEALDYAEKLRAENPMMKAHALRRACLQRFSEAELPPDGE